MENRFFSFNNQGVPGVIATLKPHNDIRVPGKEIDDLPFALISPLGSNHSDVGHVLILDSGFGILDSNLKS